MKLTNFLLKKLYLFLIIPGLLAVFCYFVGNIKVRPKEYEKVDVLVSCVDLNNKLLEEGIGNTGKVNVKEINVNFAIYGSESMSLVYNTIYKEMDVLIFPKTFLDQIIEANAKYYAKLDEEVISEYVSDVTYYEYNQEKYAIKIYDATSKSGWCDTIINYSNDNFNEDYYMFFVNNSVNLGKLKGSKYDNALTYMKAMAEYEK